MWQKGILPLYHMCVVGVSNGGGEQLGMEGRKLDLDYKVYKLKMNLLWEWARWPIPTLITESGPLPTFHQ